jgi:hypothetical protein
MNSRTYAQFVQVWRPSSVRLQEPRARLTGDTLDTLVRTVLGLVLAVVAACCYFKIVPSPSIVIAVALSTRIASIIASTGQSNDRH